VELGGGGKLTFFDMRAGAFLPANAPDDVNASCFGSPYATSPQSPLASSPQSSPPRYSSGSDADGASVDCRSRRNCLVLDSGEGWLDRTHHVFVDHFAESTEVLNACYAHAWDESGTRLLVAGGPLAYGLRGCYVGVWS
jgi:DDB1- and CUL4-associated factor 12